MRSLVTPTPNDSCQLRLRVTPRAKKNNAELEGDVLRVWIPAVPDKGMANKAVIELLAKKLGVAKSAVRLIAGEQSHNKMVSIEGLTQQEAHERLK